ncbi:MFS general substrate transporter [Hypoxylon rubiginosum]|uniref:MFS general substrate transporter n=1 Tax=Hypoxylon rubiginosum TaxID=110542 RepID=A0ACB9YL81_9PEZI|nr:MFS general substrate transporter [Hypoxylon rubiginosum]
MAASNGSVEKDVLSDESRNNYDTTSPGSPVPAEVRDPSDPSAASDNIRKITGLRWFLVCAGLYCSCLIYGLDTTIAADIQGAVVATFQNVPQLPWIGAGFSLGSVAVILPYNALFSKFNMKWLYIGGVIVFEAGSALCGAAPSIEALIVGRVIAGAGGTGIYLGGLNHFAVLTTREERSTYMTGLGFIWGVGTIIGPVVGGAFSLSSATWRWGFYINLIIGAICAPIYLFCLPPIRPTKGISIPERLRHVDWLGSALSCGMWVFFSMAFISGGGIWPWSDSRTIAMIVCFAVCLVLYVLQQYFLILTTVADRSFPGHLLKSRTQVLVLLCAVCAMLGLYVSTYYIPIYFQFVNNDSSLMAAVRLLPFLLLAIAFNLAAGWALPKINIYATFYLAAGIFLLIPGALFYVYLKPSTSVANIYGFSILMGVGCGITMQLGYAVASLKAAPEDAVNSISLQNFSQIGAQVLALVIAGRVFQSVAVNNLTPILSGHGYSVEEIQNSVAGAQSGLFQQLEGTLRTEALEAVSGAIQTTFIIVIAAGALQIVCALGLRWERLFPKAAASSDDVAASA